MDVLFGIFALKQNKTPARARGDEVCLWCQKEVGGGPSQGGLKLAGVLA